MPPWTMLMMMITLTPPKTRSSARWGRPQHPHMGRNSSSASKAHPQPERRAVLPCMQTKYVVLTKADINRRQQEVIDAVTSVLGISHEDAGRILRKYKWWVVRGGCGNTASASAQGNSCHHTTSTCQQQRQQQ